MKRGTVTGALMALAVVGVYVYSTVRVGVGADFGIGLAVLATGLLGALLLARRPGHRMGWVLAISGLAGSGAALAVVNEPGGAFYHLAGGIAWITWLFSMVVAIPLLFPTGRLPGPRWRWLGWMAGIALAGYSIQWLLQGSLCLESSGEVCLSARPNPIGLAWIPSPEASGVGLVWLVILMTAAVAAMASLFFRYRRATTVERHQLKWLLYAVGLLIFQVGVVDSILIQLVGLRIPETVYDVTIGLLWLGIPVAAGLAIFRYRLYDIDRIVSRTVTYLAVAGLLVAAYAGGVTLLTEVVPLEGNLAVAASTLGVAGLFNPLRRRLHEVVERRFNRTRYDAEHTVSHLGDQLRDGTGVEDVTATGCRVVLTTVQPATVSIWVRDL